jgi:hypothetical protein
MAPRRRHDGGARCRQRLSWWAYPPGGPRFAAPRPQPALVHLAPHQAPPANSAAVPLPPRGVLRVKSMAADAPPAPVAGADMRPCPNEAIHPWRSLFVTSGPCWRIHAPPEPPRRFPCGRVQRAAGVPGPLSEAPVARCCTWCLPHGRRGPFSPWSERALDLGCLVPDTKPENDALGGKHGTGSGSTDAAGRRTPSVARTDLLCPSMGPPIRTCRPSPPQTTLRPV